MEEEVNTQGQTEQSEPRMSMKDKQSYLKQLKANVEELELQARFHKARFEITNYIMSYDMLIGQIEQQKEEAEKAKKQEFADSLKI